MKFTKEMDRRLALFEVTRRNCAATDVGDIVEFYAFGEYEGEVQFSTLMLAQVEGRQHVDHPNNEGMFFPAGTAWFYDKSSVRPLTKLAQRLLSDNIDAQKQADKARR